MSQRRQGFGRTGRERRFHPRYPLHLPVTVWTLGDPPRELRGETVNISSTGALFSLPRLVPKDTGLRISIEWPLPSAGGRPLRLRGLARVVRSGRGLTAAHFRIAMLQENTPRIV